MTGIGVSIRDEVVALVAELVTCEPDAVREEIDSMTMTWLVHEIESRYGVAIDLDDERLWQMSTVSGTVQALEDALGERS